MALTHFDADGAAHMVDVSDKDVTDRIAVAKGYIKMLPETLDIITQGRAKKGDVIGVARLAGIMAAKRTSDLIPLCHPLPITKVSVELEPDPDLPGLRITATVKTTGQNLIRRRAPWALDVLPGRILQTVDIVNATAADHADHRGVARFVSLLFACRTPA